VLRCGVHSFKLINATAQLPLTSPSFQSTSLQQRQTIKCTVGHYFAPLHLSYSSLFNLFFDFAFLSTYIDMLLRLRGPDGMVRLTVEPTTTFGQLGEQVITENDLTWRWC
jgi:hypothetical protein